ncbi:MAG: SBBP repeat-containing protein [Leptospiraceae bacterium]|nr:SBBP repeat-containing protein [Leptospiraceae bacterium]
MKTLQPNRFKLNFGITLLCTLLIATACKSNNQDKTNTILWMFALTNSSATSTAPTISSFAPSSGSVGTSVTISGTNFSSTTTQNTVKFNGTEATVSEASSTSLTVIVPAGTSTGKISVTTTIGSVTSSEDFTVSSTSTSLVLFTKQLGNGIKSTKAQAVATDSNGNVYMAGETGSGLDGNSQAGTMDFFVVKYNSSGTSQWTKQMGVTSKTTTAEGVATDSNGNVYVAGYTTGGLDGNTLSGTYDFFVVKYDSNGSKQWTKQMGVTSKGTQGKGITIDSNGNIYIAGHTNGSLDGNTVTGSVDLFVTKYNSSGTSQWTKLLGVTSKSTLATGIATDSNGNLYIVGYTNGGLDGNTVSGTYDVFVVKYDSNGSKQWTRQMGTNSKVTDGRGIATSSDVIYITGAAQGSLDGNTTTGDYDAFVIKFNLGGSKQWTKLLGATSSSTESYGVATDSNGSIYTVGYTDGILDENKYSGSGATQAFITNKIYRD